MYIDMFLCIGQCVYIGVLMYMSVCLRMNYMYIMRYVYRGVSQWGFCVYRYTLTYIGGVSVIFMYIEWVSVVLCI